VKTVCAGVQEATGTISLSKVFPRPSFSLCTCLKVRMRSWVTDFRIRVERVGGMNVCM
jgi:hypothetical protein